MSRLGVKDRAFLKALKNIYLEVTKSPSEMDSESVRLLCAEKTKEAFSLTDYHILGSENLPYEKNCIFIYNHLENHPLYQVDNQFQITLDSHFISSMVLNKYYDNPGTRVARFSLPAESNHKAYYDRLGLIRVFAKSFIPNGMSIEAVKIINRQFYPTAINHLEQHSGLVFSPEGCSYVTAQSPGPFQNGIFKLACLMDPQPLIVPLVMANFDKLASETTFRCEIKTPFRMSDFGVMNEKSKSFREVIENVNRQYSGWVKELSPNDKHFRREIEQLKKKISQKKDKNQMTVFYGSSTIRLWKNLSSDFPDQNILNLGFGGAFVESLDYYFESLFQFDSPKVIILYLGGNDLTLGYDADQIFKLIKVFIARINQKYPNTMLINIGLKPSFERFKNLETIRRINALMHEEALNSPYLEQVNLFDRLSENGKIDKKYFLQDGLHLNEEGYKVLKQLLSPALKKAEIYA